MVIKNNFYSVTFRTIKKNSYINYSKEFYSIYSTYWISLFPSTINDCKVYAVFVFHFVWFRSFDLTQGLSSGITTNISLHWPEITRYTSVLLPSVCVYQEVNIIKPLLDKQVCAWDVENVVICFVHKLLIVIVKFKA